MESSRNKFDDMECTNVIIRNTSMGNLNKDDIISNRHIGSDKGNVIKEVKEIYEDDNNIIRKRKFKNSKTLVEA